MRKYLLPGGGPLEPIAMAQQRIAQLEAELVECRKGQAELELWRDGGILHDKFAQEIDALAAIVQQQKVALERIADTDPDSGTAWFHGVADTALALDVFQAAAILAKRDAEVLRKAAEWFHENDDGDNVDAFHELRRMSEELEEANMKNQTRELVQKLGEAYAEMEKQCQS